MDLSDAKAELMAGLAQATAHRKAHPLGHMGCHPGPPCGTLEVSVAAADLLPEALGKQDSDLGVCADKSCKERGAHLHGIKERVE